MAIMFVRAQVISRGAGRSVVSAAAYRHRAKMMDEQVGTQFRYEGGKAELVHEELALPDETPAWLKTAIDGRSVAGASEVLWNAVDVAEKRVDAQLAREMIFALPEELTQAENIALVREFVRDHLTSKGMVADWVYHDKNDNPHIHLMTTLRPLTDEGFGPKKVAVAGDDGQPLRVATPDRPNGKIVYRLWAGDKETMKAWKIGWAETANRHLALAGHEIRLDGRSYAEQGLDGIAQKHLGPEKAALARKGRELYFAPADLARRQEMADRLLAEPELLLKQLGNERSTFDERDIARALHRTVDDPIDFANIRARLMASDDLVMLKPQQVEAETSKVSEPAVFTTRDMLRIEYDMAQSARTLSERSGFAVSRKHVASAIESVESGDAKTRFRLDPEQVDAVHHVTGESGIAAVVGLAGAGKSTLLAAARLAWESQGRRVIGAALAGKAAEGLEDSSGIRSRTLASFELAWANGRETLHRGDVLVIDEAGMVASQQMARVLKIAEEAEVKVVLVGDAMQLQPIQAGAAFRAITERIGFAELAGVRRQRAEWARDASRLFARGEVKKGLDAYAEHGHLVEAGTRDETIGRIVADWTEARKQAIDKSVLGGNNGRLHGDELLVLAHTNDDVKRLNEALRSVMTQEGALSESRAFRTERGTREFAIGDRIIFLENARFLEPRARHSGPQYVKNGMLGTVISTGDKSGDPLLSVRLDNGRKVVFSEDSYRNVDHGYAATIHKSQGSTVERTFVLATGMMDQHLTYVSMTRHRDRVDLYAAGEDFAARPEWGRKPRVDHAAGVSGELVETGEAKFRPNDEDADDSPYIDVRTDDGTVHRLWGVSLPKALDDAGILEGDTVTLRKDGIERVKVQIAIVDQETGQKRYEERQVDRNVWIASRIETAETRQDRTRRESHRPELFKQLVERLSRSGAKTTTLDFASEAGYRAHADDFARRRGLHNVAELSAGIEAAVDRRLSWVNEQRDRVARLWQRASVALGFAIEHEKNLAYRDDPVVLTAPIPDDRRTLISPTTTFARRLEEDARIAQLASPASKEREALLKPVLERIYRDPGDALARLRERASAINVDPRRLAEDLGRAPSELGILRGSDKLVDGQLARQARGEAVAAAGEMATLVRAHASEFQSTASRFNNREHVRRAHMALSVPALSERARERLSEIEAIREKGGEGAYKAAFAIAAEGRSVVQEVKAVSEALTARFGWRAFTDKADTYAARDMVERMPEAMTAERQAELTALFAAVKRFADEQHLAERRDPSRIVAAAAHDPDAAASASLPMLAAVTEFKIPIEDEARDRALDMPHYKQQRTELIDAATRVWRDPAPAIAMIEDLFKNNIDPERIARAVANDPTAYGALRGSDRVMDRLLASGRERKQAVGAVAVVSTATCLSGSAYRTAFESEAKDIALERERMTIAIPGLSPKADAALKTIAGVAETTPKDFTRSVRALDPAILKEFARVSKALDARFGPNAIARDQKDAVNRVPASQRVAFEAMRGWLRTLQNAVRADSAQQIITERQTRSLNQARGMTR